MMTALVLLTLALPAVAAVTVDCAYWHVDIGGQYAWSESAPGLADFARTHERAGLLKVFVRNDGPAPATVEARTLNGADLEALRTGDRHEVIWWRTWPNPVPPGALAEVAVRLRYPLTEDPVLGIDADGAPLEVTVPATPPPFRIETVGWEDGGGRVTVVAQKIRDEPVEIVRVELDGADVTGRARIPTPGFFGDVCPIILDLETPLETGAFHTYKLISADGQAVACTLRTLDEFMRLGMYGASDLEANVKLGLNIGTHFHRQGRAALERYAAFGQRAAFHVNADPPAPDVRGHPAVYAYLLHDEPDCRDYGATDWPMPLRIGYHAMENVAHTRRCAEADPGKPVMITLNLTFKPANYFVYAQIPDIIAPDCYPIAIGTPLRWVREVTEVCRSAAGPRRVDMIPQVNFEDRQNREMKFRRPPFAGEVIIQYLYALGAGARGFDGWAWFDEKADWCHFYGAPNYPDVLDALRRTFRRLALLRPLILNAHPTDWARCDIETIWARTLVCGDEAMLVVLVNDDYDMLSDNFVQRPAEDLTITLPHVPWLDVGYAGLATEDGFTQAALDVTDDGLTVSLPRVQAGEIILLARDEAFARGLAARHEADLAGAALALLRGARHNQLEKAELAALKRHLPAMYPDYMLELAAPLSAYGVKDDTFINPGEVEYPGIEWWTEARPRGGEWKLSIDAARAGVPHTLYFQTARWWGGGYLRIEVADAAGNLVAEMERPPWEGPIPNVRVTFPAEGDYALRILHAGEGKPGGRLGRFIFVAPDTAPPLPGPPW